MKKESRRFSDKERILIRSANRGIRISGVSKDGDFLYDGEKIKVKTDGTFKRIRIGDVEFEEAKILQSRNDYRHSASSRNVVADLEKTKIKLSDFIPDSESESWYEDGE